MYITREMVDTGLVCTLAQQIHLIFTANLLILPNTSHESSKQLIEQTSLRYPPFHRPEPTTEPEQHKKTRQTLLNSARPNNTAVRVRHTGRLVLAWTKSG